VKAVWDPRDLTDDVFADPQRLNPGNIIIQRTIRLGAPAVDTAVFSGNRAEYDVTRNANGSVTVAHARPVAAAKTDGTDTLLNIEVLQFADGSVAAPGAVVSAVPTVANLLQATAAARITAAGLTVGTITTAPSATIVAGGVISSDPVAGTFEFPGFAVNLVVSSTGPAGPVAPTITSPANGAGVKGTVNVTASVTSPVAGVQFLLDGNPLGAVDTTTPYSVQWNTTTASNGLHVLTAQSSDIAGNTATSIGVSVDVGNDPTAPAVAITAPRDGATVTGSKVTVSANATDNVGVVGVQFLLDGAPLGAEVTTAPYTTRWNSNSGGKGGTNLGPHSLSARARDAAGNVTTSAPVRVLAQ
jgi:hypothetical protein